MSVAAQAHKIGKGTHHWGHAVLPVIYVVTGAVLAIGAYLFDSVEFVCSRVEQAKSSEFASALPEPGLFYLGVAAVLAGRWFSKLGEPPPIGPQSEESAAITQRALLVTLVIVAGFWFFEAMGTAQVNIPGFGRAEAITHYIRCALILDNVEGTHGVASMFVVVLLCFGAGHWLWADHPEPDGSAS